MTSLGLSDESALLGVVSWSEWSHCPRNDSGYCLNQENLIFFSFFSSELHKVAYQGWHVVILHVELLDTIFLDKLTAI